MSDDKRATESNVESLHRGDGWRVPVAVAVRERGFILAFTLSAVITALLLTYVVSEKYEASLTIFYRPQEVTRLKYTEAQSFGAPTPTPPLKVIGNTLRDVARSEAILGPVVTAMGLDHEIPATEGSAFTRWIRTVKNVVHETRSNITMLLKYGRIVDEDPVVEAMDQLRENVWVSSRDSYVFRLTVRDKVPHRVAGIANKLGDELVGWLREHDRKPGRDKEKQLRRLLAGKREEMERYRSQIEALLADTGIASVAMEIEEQTERLSHLEVTRIGLEGDLRKREASLAGLQERLQPRTQRVAFTTQQPAHRIPPDEYRRLEAEALFGAVELEGLQAKYRTVRSAVDATAHRLVEMPLVKRNLDRLEADLEAAKQEFLQLADTHQEALVRATNAMSQAKIISPAVDPTAPVAPIKLYNVGLAGMLSLVVALALVLIFDFASIRILLRPRQEGRNA